MILIKGIKLALMLTGLPFFFTYDPAHYARENTIM